MLLTLEGLDGSGKTTAWEALAGSHPDVTFTREPTSSRYGDAVARSMGDDDADPLAELFLFTADHADHLSRVIRPALAAGSVVVSDRYSDSRLAYQAASLSDSRLADDRDPLSYIRAVHEPFSRPPDATIYLDIDPETAAARAGATNKFERAAYLEDVRENYERLIDADPDRFVRVDATRSESTVVDAVERHVERLVDGA
ncbi:thymidylate kinase [Halobellus salinus]|uniref:Probable thymidylate kinase n=1 Tax=Halobellus salinus TaxID=931585 RepID=A0A830ENG6_9EURY|nr:dTMP kinase [Halobellus salinus]GGJ08059.1 thymidylate kinase [Halobellus salinus]SMP27883.1 thymidylate kinase [Halobellus salinus]